jgi:hypothetical protein
MTEDSSAHFLLLCTENIIVINEDLQLQIKRLTIDKQSNIVCHGNMKNKILSKVFCHKYSIISFCTS